jgi:hypothetical protein
MPTVSTTKAGAFRIAIEANKEAMAYFSQADQNRMIRTASHAGAQQFVDRDLFRRFSRWAIGALGHFVSTKWARAKQRMGGVDLPFVGLTPLGGGPPTPRSQAHNAEKMNAAIARGARATAVAKRGDATATVLLPFGHAVQPQTAQRFATMHPSEVNSMAEEQARVLASILSGASPEQAGKRQLVGAMSPIGVAPRASGKPTSRGAR